MGKKVSSWAQFMQFTVVIRNTRCHPDFVRTHSRRKSTHYCMIAQETDWLRQSNCVIIERREHKILLPFFCLSSPLFWSGAGLETATEEKPPPLPSQGFLTTPLSFAPSRPVSLSVTAPGGLSFFFLPLSAPSLPSHPSSGWLPLFFSPSEDFIPRRILWTLNFTVNSPFF